MTPGERRGPDETRQARVQAIGCGDQHTAVLLVTGDVYAAGSNEYGACAQGDECKMEVLASKSSSNR